MDAQLKHAGEELSGRITDYLISGGLFNPELAIHENVRDLLVDIQDHLNLLNNNS